MHRFSFYNCVRAALCWGILLLVVCCITWAFGLPGLVLAVGSSFFLYQLLRRLGRTQRICIVLAVLALGGLLAEPILGYNRQTLPDAVERLGAVTNAANDRDAVLAYVRAGRLLHERVYRDTTGMDLIRAVRQEGRLGNRLARLGGDSRLSEPWVWSDEDTNPVVSVRQHYEGFAAGPASALETLIREDDGTGSESHRALLEFAQQHYGGLPASLTYDVQDRLAEDFLSNDPAGRHLAAYRGGWCRDAAREYMAAVRLFAAPGEVARWLVPCGAVVAAGSGAVRPCQARAPEGSAAAGHDDTHDRGVETATSLTQPTQTRTAPACRGWFSGNVVTLFGEYREWDFLTTSSLMSLSYSNCPRKLDCGAKVPALESEGGELALPRLS